MGEVSGMSGGAAVFVNESLFTILTASFNSMAEELKSLRKDTNALTEENKRISNSVTSLDKNLKKKKKNFNDVKREIMDLKQQNNLLKQENVQLKNEIIELKKSIRNDAIKITNFPVLEHLKIAWRFFEKICEQIKFNCNKDIIQNCYRLKNRNIDYAPPIIVKFLKIVTKFSFRFLEYRRV